MAVLLQAQQRQRVLASHPLATLSHLQMAQHLQKLLARQHLALLLQQQAPVVQLEQVAPPWVARL